jgi:arginase
MVDHHNSPASAMKRRQFLIGSTAAASTTIFRGQTLGRGKTMSERTYHILGVPLRSGSLYPGSENDAQAYRDVHLLARLQKVGCDALDEGDVAIPSYLPHHSIPPIRSWPGPRIAWECVSERVAPYLQQPGHIPLLIGCDCSVVIGSAQALMRARSDNIHILYVDGDFDDAAPDPARCQSAASLGVWLLTQASPFWAGPVLKASQVTVVGWTRPPRSEHAGMAAISLADVRRLGAPTAARSALEAIPASASVLLHFDIDVLRALDMPAAYFPHPEGLSVSEASMLLAVLLRDPRVRLIEISEYATLRDPNQSYVNTLVDLLVEGLKG